MFPASHGINVEFTQSSVPPMLHKYRFFPIGSINVGLAPECAKMKARAGFPAKRGGSRPGPEKRGDVKEH